MNLVWFAVVDTSMSYALPTIYADERDRHRSGEQPPLPARRRGAAGIQS